MAKDLITIIVLCYNQKQFIEECLNAVYSQTYDNIQVIVTDDCSKDGSSELIRSLSQQHKFETIICPENIGLNAILAKAIALSKGEYISIIAADDYMLHEKTAEQLNYIKSRNLDGIYANGYSLINEEKTLIKLNEVFRTNNKKRILNYVYQFDWGAPLLQSGLFKSKIFKEGLPLRQQYKSDDWAFLIYAYENFDIGFLDKPLFCYRLHSNNSFKNYWITFPMRLDVVSRLVPEAYRVKALGNILFSQGQYLSANQFFFKGLRLMLASMLINFSGRNVLLFLKSMVSYFKSKLSNR